MRGLLALTLSAASAAAQSGDPDMRRGPNFVVIFTDDQGYGDLGCYGSETIATPRLDRLAAEGTRFTDFYAQVVCGPSRSALLTGRYPVRSLGWSMPAHEVTIAELLRERGYATCCIGKWDVSNRAAIPERMPTAQGFDRFSGTLGANDSGHVVLWEDGRPVGDTSDMGSLTRRYTDAAIEFVEEHRTRPFFLYLAHTMVHSVIDASPEFRGKSRGGLYGDVVEELDHECGRLLDAIDEAGLRDDTLVLFTSDNGPWSNMTEALAKRHGGQVAWGSSGPLRAAKGSTYEGGIRVPCIVRWPGRVPDGRTSDAIFSTLDLLPTFGRLAGYAPPDDRMIDGVDQTDLLLGRSDRGARSDFLYFCRGELQAVRVGRWKLMLPNHEQRYGYVDDRGSGGTELYDLRTDVGETRDLAADRPDVVAELLAHARAQQLPSERFDPRIRLPGGLHFVDDPARGAITVLDGSAPVLTYNYGDQLADGVPADRTRSSYVHPIWGLDGEILTDDFPADHHHHRGLSLMWPRMRVGELGCELWHIRGIRSLLGEIRAQRVDDGVAVLEIANRWRLLEQDRDVAHEDLTLRVHPATKQGRAVDVVYRLEATAEPIELVGQVEKGYGGLNLRFAPREDTVLTTETGHHAKSSDRGRFAWADLSARFGGRGAQSGVAILVSPDHPHAPPPWTLRYYGDLNVAWPGLEPFVLAPKEPVTLRYRLWIHRGDAAAGEVAAAYREFASR